MNPKISVIVPFYQTTELQLRICIDSVLKQSFSDLELLVIDDGSPRDHSALMQDYEKKDPRVIYIRQENAGVSAARNRGLEQARGEYVAFLDSDDYWENGFLYTMLDTIQGNDLAICGLADQWYEAENSTMDSHIFFSFPSRFIGIQYTNFVLNKLFRTSIIREHGLQFSRSVQLGEDAIFLDHYLLHCKTIRSISQKLYHYIANEDSAVHTYHRNFWTDEEQVICLQWQLFHQYPLNAVEDAYMQYWLYLKLSYILFYYSNREKDPGMLDQILQQVLTADCFRPLMGHEAKIDFRFFGKAEKAQLKQLLADGVEGAKKNYRRSTRKAKIDELKRIVLH